MRIASLNGRSCYQVFIGCLNVIMSVQLLAAEPKTAESPRGRVAFQSAERKTTLLELFTSEGCSSCPPAEAWLSRLKDSPRLWKDFVPVAFHVDYWDYLGWRDQWGSKAFSDRQRAYAQSWRSDTVYTPGFVLDGKEWHTWSNHKDGPPAVSNNAGVLKVTSTDLHDWQVNFSPLSISPSQYDVYAVLLATGLRSQISAGENRGRLLVHDFVTLEMTEGWLKPTGKEAMGEFNLAGESKSRQGRFALAVWVTLRGGTEPLQATGGWLPAR